MKTNRRVPNALAAARSATAKLTHHVEDSFSVIMWVGALWLLTTWFCPLLMQMFVSVIYLQRTGHFTNLVHVRYFQNSADSIFIFLIIFAVVMLFLTVVITGVYIYRVHKNRHKLPYRRALKMNCMETPGFKIAWLVCFLVFMVLVSVASIFSVTCSDNQQLKDSAAEAMYPPYSPNEVRLMRRLIRDGLEHATGDPLAYNRYMGGGLGASDHLVLISANSTQVHSFSSDDVEALRAAGNLHINGVAATQAQATALTGGNATAYMYTVTGSVYNLVVPTYSYSETEWEDTQPLDFNLAAIGHVPSDVNGASSVRYSLVKNGTASPTTRDVVEYATRQAVRTGLAAAHVILMQNGLARGVMVNRGENMLDLGSVMRSVASCGTMNDFANVMFFISFIAVILSVLAMFIYGRIMKRRKPYAMNYSRVPAEAAAMLQGGPPESDEEDVIYDAASFRTWSQVGSSNET